jgi:hypothetical protein
VAAIWFVRVVQLRRANFSIKRLCYCTNPGNRGFAAVIGQLSGWAGTCINSVTHGRALNATSTPTHAPDRICRHKEFIVARSNAWAAEQPSTLFNRYPSGWDQRQFNCPSDLHGSWLSYQLRAPDDDMQQQWPLQSNKICSCKKEPIGQIKCAQSVKSMHLRWAGLSWRKLACLESKVG